MDSRQANWAGKYVKVVYSNGLGENIGFVEKDEGESVRAWWRGTDNSITSSSNQKRRLEIVLLSADD